MRLLKSIFNFQVKKAVNKRNALVFLFIAVILQIFLQVGKANHSDILESKVTFQKQEQQKMSRYLHYGQYGSFGIWLKLIPHANSIFYSDSTCDNLLCNLNSTYVFNIYTPIKGKRLFANRSRFLNFSAMFFLLGVLGCIVYGMDTMVRKDYLKFISNLNGRAKAFWLPLQRGSLFSFRLFLFCMRFPFCRYFFLMALTFSVLLFLSFSLSFFYSYFSLVSDVL